MSKSSAEQAVRTVWHASLADLWQVPALPAFFFEKKCTADGTFGRLAATSEALAHSAWLDLTLPVRLKTHFEKKPWGQEIWFTGIEKRGVCNVETIEGSELSLSAYLSLHAGPHACETKNLSPVPLLKILDPHPELERGCLYIEVHQEKWETYVVTAVDPHAWPSGQGEILFGFSEQKLAQLKGQKEHFRAQAHAAVSAYENLRRAVEMTPSLAENEQWRAQERLLWQEVRAWFDVKKVVVGDVIAVPPFTPHSLQHGVRVVEFQTPTYERLILAFNQKVQTQNHWDTAEALRVAQFPSVQSRAGETAPATTQALQWQQIVDFPGFKVHRNALPSRSSVALMPAHPSQHALVFVVAGCVQMSCSSREQVLSLEAEQAALLPVDSDTWMINNHADEDAVVLFV